jgi:LuxR family maltose regulon positive regulatory protein
MTSFLVTSKNSCKALADSLKGALESLRQGRFADAERALETTPECSAPSSPPDQRYQCLLLQARARLALAGRDEALAALHRAFAYGREKELLECALCQAPDILATLCAEALVSDIEAEYVRRLIRQSHLSPPSPAVAQWPYPVRIYTLGRPAIVVDGQPIVFSGKAQRRPLELLYYLVANGGREFAVSRLISALWGDEDGAVSRNAFDMALNRLRRLVDVPEAFLLRGGRLSLSEGLCWIDIRAFERLLGDADAEKDMDCRQALLERALGLYQGDFLQGEETSWAVLARERLRSRLMRSITRTGQSLEEAGRWPEATRLYDRVRELFPLEEDLCRRLLRSHIEQGEYVQATHLYGRCRELFVKVLGVLPSPGIVALINRLPTKSTH